MTKQHEQNQALADLKIKMRSSMDKLLSISATSSRILSVRDLVIQFLGESVVEYDFQEFEQHATELFSVTLGPYKGTIDFNTYRPIYDKKRRIGNTSSALAMNKMLIVLQNDWSFNQTRSSQAQYLKLQDFLSRTFVLCSEKSRYEIEHDDGFWSCHFCDINGLTSLEIIIERKN